MSTLYIYLARECLILPVNLTHANYVIIIQYLFEGCDVKNCIIMIMYAELYKLFFDIFLIEIKQILLWKLNLLRRFLLC